MDIPSKDGRYIICTTKEIKEPYRSKYLYRFTLALKTEVVTFNNIDDVFDYIISKISKSDCIRNELRKFSIFDRKFNIELISTDNLNYRQHTKKDYYCRNSKCKYIFNSVTSSEKYTTKSCKNIHRIYGYQPTGRFNLMIDNIFRNPEKTLSKLSPDTREKLINEY